MVPREGADSSVARTVRPPHPRSPRGNGALVSRPLTQGQSVLPRLQPPSSPPSPTTVGPVQLAGRLLQDPLATQRTSPEVTNPCVWHKLGHSRQGRTGKGQR